jgi:hypothetical protein
MAVRHQRKALLQLEVPSRSGRVEHAVARVDQRERRALEVQRSTAPATRLVPVESEASERQEFPAAAPVWVRLTQVTPASNELQMSFCDAATSLRPEVSEATLWKPWLAAGVPAVLLFQVAPASREIQTSLAPASKLFPDASDATAFQFMRAAPLPSEASSQVEKSPSAPCSVVPESAMLKPLALS